MPLRVRHRPKGTPQAIVITNHCRIDSDLIGDLPVASVEVTPYVVDEVPETISKAKLMVGAPTAAHVALVGFSAGCQSVRSWLMKGVTAAVWMTIDGTHSSWPMHPAHLNAWSHLAEEAELGSTMWIATCTQMTYTEKLHKAIASTVSVLEASTGFELREPPRPYKSFREGGLVVESHHSESMDSAAHVKQVRVTMPRLVRDELLPRLIGLGVATEPAPVSLDWRDIDDNLGARACAYMGHQYGMKVREIPGGEHDATILSYSQHCRRKGSLVGVDENGAAIWTGGVPLRLGRDEDPWCAAISSECLRVCLRYGEEPPHGFRVSVRELCEDARVHETLREKLFLPMPGDLAIMGRGGQNPLHGGQGHVRRVIQVKGDEYLGIGGNESNAVQVKWHRLIDVVGWIAYS
jgi:hypothetical protein